MKQFLKSYTIIALGSLAFALGFDWFFAPNQIAMGGVTGLAQVINVLIPALPVGILTIILNVPLFLAGWKLIGFHLLASSLFSMAVSSVAIDIIAAWYTFPPMDPLLACLCGGAVMGAGFGLVFSQGATTGGTDIIVRLLKLRYKHVETGKLFFCTDLVVVSASILVFHDLNTGLYALLSILLFAIVFDLVLYGGDTAKMVYVVSEREQAIASRIMAELELGVTYVYGEGAYTGKQKRVILCVAKKQFFPKIKDIVKEEDRNAFLIISNASDIYGEGFKDHFAEEF